MSDFERYGDYNEIEESPSKSITSKILKGLVFLVCVLVIGFLAFRLFIFNYYPDEITKLYFTEELTEHYNTTQGDIGALTQELLNSSNFGYDDSKDGNFFARNFIYIPKTEELQVTLRYNTAIFKNIEKEYGIKLDPSSKDNFSFRLVGMRASDKVDDDTPKEEIGKVFDCDLKFIGFAENFMYRYIKLSFDGVDLGVGTPDAVDWLRLEISVNVVEMKKPYMILIYYNIENFPLIPYELSGGERP